MGQVSTEPQLTDRSAPELQTTELPSFATPTPVIGSKLPSIPELHINTSAPNIRPLARGDSFLNMPLSENSRSKQFTQRLDYMVGEFFTRQVAKLATSTPEGVDRIHKIFTQRIREKLGQQWAHVTAQPEVDEASKEVEVMYEYFSQLEKMVEKQRNALQMLNEAEAELSLFYQQMGYQEHGEELGDHLVHLGMGYHQECKQRVPLIGALDSYLAFVKTFRAKAINDSRDTIKSQKTARVEFDSYASKLGHLEEKAIKASQKAGAAARSKGEDTAKYQEKELDQTRCRFQAAKTRYQVLSTQVIDKAGLLEMKRGVDYLAHIEHLRKGT
ncbi:Arfaptin-like domain-containing protein [Gaertneriomyces semiglobifer]|nr:Arfaptin-like domain-containing protein [Gaertneriomyces semiglobifer]